MVYIPTKSDYTTVYDSNTVTAFIEIENRSDIYEYTYRDDD